MFVLAMDKQNMTVLTRVLLSIIQTTFSNLILYLISKNLVNEEYRWV